MIDDVRVRLAAVIAHLPETERPPEAAFVDMGAFGQRTMAFVQWLRWVFVPNVEQLIASDGPWPASSSVTTIAVREDMDEALVDALAAFDALFSEEPGRNNRAGWTLLLRGRDLPAAVSCFRRSLAREPSVTEAVANLGNALVALGRETAELEALATGDTPLAAAAHNWLGWKRSDPAHLREAVRIRPAWGVAWQNLARVLDAAGDIGEACRAYSEAIACGDSHDDTFARDRRLQLEMQLLARNEPVPAMPDTVRADSAAFSIVRAAAMQLPTPHVFMVRPTTRTCEYAIIGTVALGRALGHAIVAVGGATLLAIVLAHEGDVVVLSRVHAVIPAPDAASSHAVDPDRVAEPARALAAWVAALDPGALTPLDAAVWLRDVVVAKLPGAWSLDVMRASPATIAVRAAEIGLLVTARRGGGVELALPALAVGTTGDTLVAEAPPHLLELASTIEHATRRAIEARDAFVRRPFSIRDIAARIGEATGLAHNFFGQYPAWPDAWVSDVVHVVERADGFTLEIGPDTFTVTSPAELDAPAVHAAIAAERARVRLGRCREHDQFRVTAPFGCFAPGTEVELTQIAVVSREGEVALSFRSDGRSLTLSQVDDAEREILATLDRYLTQPSTPSNE